MASSNNIWSQHPLQHPDSIRVLALEPESDLTKQEIRCRISCTRLRRANTRPYSAISYACGTAEAARVIWVNGLDFRIRPNLHDALLNVWSAYPTEVLWVDAISIHQKNNDEKMRQVSQMTNIYASAALVHIWLGNEISLSAVAWRFLEVAGEDPADMRLVLTQTPITSARLPEWDEMERQAVFRICRGELGLRSSEPSRWDADTTYTPFAECMPGILDLLDRPWWRRVWTYQEAIVAQDAIVHCGSLQMQLIWFLSALARLDGSLVPARLQKWTKATLHAISIIHRDEKPRWEKMDLQELLIATRHRQAEDPRDHIYALLGFVDKIIYPTLEPDYTKTPESVYKAATRACIVANRGFAVLGYAGLAERRSCASVERLDKNTVEARKNLQLEERLPTWVPNFNRQPAGPYKMEIPFVTRLLTLEVGDYLAGQTSILEGHISDSSLNRIVNAAVEDHLAVEGYFIGFMESLDTTDIPIRELPDCILSRQTHLGKRRVTEMSAERLAYSFWSHRTNTCQCSVGGKKQLAIGSIPTTSRLYPNVEPGDWICCAEEEWSLWVLRPRKPHLGPELRFQLVLVEQREAWNDDMIEDATGWMRGDESMPNASKVGKVIKTEFVLC